MSLKSRILTDDVTSSMANKWSGAEADDDEREQTLASGGVDGDGGDVGGGVDANDDERGANTC